MLRDRMIDRVVGADVDVEPVVDVRKSPTDQDILEVVAYETILSCMLFFIIKHENGRCTDGL